MLRMSSYAEHVEHLDEIAAVLHDVLEDSTLTPEDLGRAGYPQAVLEAVECLTRRAGEPYEAFIERIKRNPLATRVKLADLDDNINDNMDLSRISAPSNLDMKRLEKYLRARMMLQQNLKTGPQIEITP